MTIEEARDALQHDQPCEFYSSGKGLLAWLDEGWHEVELKEVTGRYVQTKYGPYTIKVAVEDIRSKLRLLPVAAREE